MVFKFANCRTFFATSILHLDPFGRMAVGRPDFFPQAVQVVRRPQGLEGLVMRLHMVQTNLTAAAPTAGAEAMDPAKWCKLPLEILWKVLVMVPPPKRYQFQLVSRQWRQELTSAAFRKAVADREREKGAQPAADASVMVTCVQRNADAVQRKADRVRNRVHVAATPGKNAYGCWGDDDERIRNSAVLVSVDIDLTFIPRLLFWGNRSSFSYKVLAAADGLVCIASADAREAAGRPSTQAKMSLCVVNPVSRTFRMLPELPILGQTRLIMSYGHHQCAVHLRAGWTTVMVNICRRRPATDMHWALATYDLTAPAAEEQQWTVARGPACQDPTFLPSSCSHHLIWCDGLVFCYLHTQRCVLVDAVTGRDNGVVAVAASRLPDDTMDDVCMAESRGSVYVVATVRDGHLKACRVWRLDATSGNSVVVWHRVASMPRKKLDQLTGFRYVSCGEISVFQAFPIGDKLCFQLSLWDGRKDAPPCPVNVMVGFNLERTNIVKWELLYHEKGLEFMPAYAFELRPNSFL